MEVIVEVKLMLRLEWLLPIVLVISTTNLSAWSQTAGSQTANSQTANNAPAKTVPGIEFTKIQDLNPNARGTNRPIKQKWAVVIGASKFKEGRLASTAATGMAQSAKEFHQYLVDPQGGRFDRNHVKLLIDADAPRQSIMTALGPSFLGNAVGPDDLVVVYIATSGFPTTDGNTYLCTYDCALDNIYGTCISMQTLMSTLKQNVHSDRILLVLQAAYSGAAELEAGAKSLIKGPPTYNLDPTKVLLGNGYIILSSSQPNQITWSTAFSKNLTSALRQEDGLISLNKAFAIAKQKTESETAATGLNKKQVPVMKSAWKGAELVLGAPPVERVANLPASLNSFLSAEGAYLKASKLIAEGKTDEALDQYKLAIAADPKYADALADCGAAYTMKDDWKSAADMYKRAIAINSSDGLFHLNYARILDKLGEKDSSLEELNMAYRINPKDMSVLIALSNQSLAAGKADAAVRYLEEAVDLYPSRADSRERLSYALMKSGDVGHAVAQAKEAVHLDPKSASAQTLLGSLLMVQGYVGPAVDAYKEAAKLSPNDLDVIWLLSRSMEKNGDREGAIAQLNLFLQLCSPSDSRALKAKEHLEELKAR
jgi:tetratricopeptide (TPR) repeat protein